MSRRKKVLLADVMCNVDIRGKCTSLTLKVNVTPEIRGLRCRFFSVDNRVN